MSARASEEIRHQWKESILKQRESGLSVRVWCQENNIPIHKFRYWKNKLFIKNLTRCDFQEISEVEETKWSGLLLKYEGIEICLNEDFSPLALKKCIKALKGISC